MADQQRELVYCHGCTNEWYRDEYGLQCPRCESEFVEVIEHDHDPRESGEDLDNFLRPTALLPSQRSLHNHNPWGEDAPDPDEGNIEHVEYRSGNLRFSRTSIRSPPPGMRSPGQGPPDFVNQILMQMLASPPSPGGAGERLRGAHRVRVPRGGNVHDQSREDFPGANFFGPTSPLQEGPGMQGPGRTFTASTRFRSRDPGGPPTQDIPFEDVHRLLRQILGGLSGTVVVNNNPDGGPSPLNFLSQILSPANANHGDVVYTQEALDRVISQLMEQHNTSSAPGPASAAAIAALPKAKIEESMLGSDGKAECSVCMDNVEVGDEVTMLPCKHWFHGDCVGAWLKEHDTCPHCRQSITPKDGDPDTPRSPGQTPRHMQTPWDIPLASGSRQRPYVVSDSPPPSGPSSRRPSSGRRPSTQSGSSGGGASGGGGFIGWASRQFGSRNHGH